MTKLNVKDFFNSDYVDQASYDNLRKISSAIDGLKNASRKVIHTVLDKKINELLKVQQLSSKASEYTDYLHGSLDGVIVTLGQNYTGSNNLPLLDKKGNFGTRTIPEASAARYIFCKGSKHLSKIFNEEDRDILIHQTFEGSDIEPKFFVPSIPLLLLNGNRGLSSGFSQYILPRDLNDLINSLEIRLTNRSDNFDFFNNITPKVKGFKGTFTKDDDFRWVQEGVYHVKNKELIIEELPLNINILEYIQYLDELKDNKTIKDFKDLCDGDDFKFIITFKDANNPILQSKDEIQKLFKLKTTITENFTSLGNDNKIKEFKSPAEVFEHYYQTKLTFLHKRKMHKLELLEDKLIYKLNQARFIKEVQEGKIDLKAMTEPQVRIYLNENDYDKMNDSFSYLTSMSISSLQKDKLLQLQKEIVATDDEHKELTNTKIEKLWLDELKSLKTIGE